MFDLNSRLKNTEPIETRIQTHQNSRVNDRREHFKRFNYASSPCGRNSHLAFLFDFKGKYPNNLTSKKIRDQLYILINK